VYPRGRLNAWPRHCEKVLPLIYEARAHADGVVLDTGALNDARNKGLIKVDTC